MEKTSILDIFGKLVFTREKMKERLDADAFAEFENVAAGGGELSRELAYKVAAAMKDWALETGATHYTHWFQPLTNNTAEKHNAFLSMKQGAPIIDFTGKNLVRDEVDASSFPSGGTRAAFEARGYTVWDCTSPAFVKCAGESKILCIPTAFCGFNGEVLDKKIPLLKSMEAIEKQSLRVLKLLGSTAKSVRVNLGAEQEYFLVDKGMYQKRKDLIFSGRTLFGAPAPKGQEKEDQYYASLRERVLAFMTELNTELWKLGIPAKTQHNETAPGQHELAPLYGGANIATDQNQLIMELMRKVADRHRLSCILHEKPFEGVNGSGKHCNWSLCTEDGRNLFKLRGGENITTEFLIFFTAVIAAVDEYQELLRASAANPGNDLRLGGNEAPPAIMSVYAGGMLSAAIENIANEGSASGTKKERLKTGVSTMPSPFIDNNDRNRTSPFAFTGTKFEFRLVGASASTATPVTVLNAAVAQKLSEIADVLEKKPAGTLDAEIKLLLAALIKKHRRIIFDGNNYSPEWVAEAARRGLSNIGNCVDAMECYKAEKNIKMLESTGVHSRRELDVRYEINLDNYTKTTNIEGRTMLSMADCDIIPAVLAYRGRLLKNISSGGKMGASSPVEAALIAEIDKDLTPLYAATRALQAALDGLFAMNGTDLHAKAVFCRDKIIPAMRDIRRHADALERITAADLWPFPKYCDLLFYE